MYLSKLVLIRGVVKYKIRDWIMEFDIYLGSVRIVSYSMIVKHETASIYSVTGVSSFLGLSYFGRVV